MNDFLPSRSVVAFVLVPVITVLAIWYVFQKDAVPEDFVAPEDKLAETLTSGNLAFQEQDTDNDGLKDWEEFLYLTDETNPDTDGDGVSDAAEVNRGFDPLVAGNGTSTDAVDGQAASPFTYYKEDETLSRTDLLARDVFVAYAELKEADALQLESIRDQAINRAITESTAASDELVYTTEDLNLTGSTRSQVQTYKQAYAEAVSGLSGIQFSELYLFYAYIQDGDDTALSELEKNRALYQSFQQQLVGMQVPAEIGLIHLELMNNTQILVNTIDKMLLVNEDPVLALAASQKIIEDEVLIGKNTQALSLFFQSHEL